MIQSGIHFVLSLPFYINVATAKKKGKYVYLCVKVTHTKVGGCFWVLLLCYCAG